MNLLRFKQKLVALKVRFQRGVYWISFVKGLVILLIALKVYGIPLIYLVPILLLGAVLASCIGYFDYKHGIWLEEVRYSTVVLNPAWQDLIKDVEEIRVNVLAQKEKGNEARS